jgi:adenylate cyclase
MVGFGEGRLVDSKEVLRISGISRATLNNYIRMGIVPRPVVGKPRGGMRGVKKIGYFPEAILGRIEMVKRLKKEGNSIEEIARRLRELPAEEERVDRRLPEGRAEVRVKEGVEVRKGIAEEKLRLTLEDVSFPAYLINYNFQIEWINPEAESKIFKQAVKAIEDVESRNIFKLFFNWEFHRLVQNWKDLIAFHMGFAKTKFSKTWIAKLYHGISKGEIRTLEEIYDRISVFPMQIIKDTPFGLLMKDGTTERYRVYSVLFREGIFFIFAPADMFSQGG